MCDINVAVVLLDEHILAHLVSMPLLAVSWHLHQYQYAPIDECIIKTKF